MPVVEIIKYNLNEIHPIQNKKFTGKKKTELKQKQPNLGSHWLKTSKAARFTSQKAGQRENKVPRGNRAKEREKKVHTVYKSADPESGKAGFGSYILQKVWSTYM